MLRHTSKLVRDCLPKLLAEGEIADDLVEMMQAVRNFWELLKACIVQNFFTLGSRRLVEFV